MAGASAILEAIIHGLLLGGLYGMLTLGLSLIFGVLGIINLAHGSFIMLGAYTAYWMFVLAGFNPLLSLIVAFPLGFIMGMAMYRFIVSRVIDAPHLTWILLFFGIMTFIDHTALLAWGSEYRGIPFSLPTLEAGGIHVPLSYIVGFVSAMVMTAGLYVLLYKTRIGKAIRAVSQDREAAALMGIDVNKILAIAFALGTAITMAGGCILVVVSPTIYIGMGAHWMDLAFCIAVLGGLGSPTGALIGGFIFGIIETLSIRLGLLPEAVLAPALAFVILILVLLIRPEGIMGRKV